MKRARSKNLRRIFLALAALLTLAFAGWWATQDNVTSSSNSFFVVNRGDLLISVSESGAIKAASELVIRNNLEGASRILTLVPEGTHVKKGELLIELDASELKERIHTQELAHQDSLFTFLQAQENLKIQKSLVESTIKDAELQVELAQTDLEKYRDGDAPQQLRTAQARISILEEEVATARQRALRTDELFAKGNATKSEVEADNLSYKRRQLQLDQSKEDLRLTQKFTQPNTLRLLESNVEKARSELERLKLKSASELAQAEADLKTSKNALDVMEAALNQQKRQLDFTRISAPQEGVVVYATTSPFAGRGESSPAEGRGRRGESMFGGGPGGGSGFEGRNRGSRGSRSRDGGSGGSRGGGGGSPGGSMSSGSPSGSASANAFSAGASSAGGSASMASSSGATSSGPAPGAGGGGEASLTGGGSAGSVSRSSSGSSGGGARMGGGGGGGSSRPRSSSSASSGSSPRSSGASAGSRNRNTGRSTAGNTATSGGAMSATAGPSTSSMPGQQNSASGNNPAYATGANVYSTDPTAQTRLPSSSSSSFGSSDPSATLFMSSIIEEGAPVRQRQELLKLPDMSQMVAEIKVHESRVRQLQRGMPAFVKVESIPNRHFRGTVRKVALLPDAQSNWMNPDVKLYSTEILIEEELPLLKPGVSARAEIIITKLTNVLSVPLHAVVLHQGKQVCYIEKNGVPTPTPVATGWFNDQFIEIKSGIQDGDRVLLTPPQEPAAAEDDPGAEPDGTIPSTTPPTPTASLPPIKPAPNAL